jgi:methyl-accepting chemotaxis protein
MNLDALMRRFTIRFRMMGAIGVVALALGAIGAIGAFGQLYANRMTTQLVGQDLASVSELLRLQQAMAKLRLHEKDLVLHHDNSAAAAAANEAWSQAFQQVQASTATLAPLLPLPSQRAQLQQIGLSLQAWRDALAPLASRLASQGFASAQLAATALSKTEPLSRQADDEVKALASDLQATSQTHQAALQATVNQVVWLIVGTTLLLLAIIVPLTILNMQSICAPIEQAEQVANAIAQGDLTDHHINTHGQDEAARLLGSLVVMRESLSRLVGQVRLSTDSMSIASAEIAAGNQDLSTRTEQTANNLQRTASSMDQLTSTVGQTAEAARQANALASSAAEVAHRGGQVVAQVVTTMSDIHGSSQRINDIIGVIDGIAFQTNILALNAAVEAARAGEQGRGFAVVASEVRSLAGRSAGAAKEIKNLIGASVERIETGSRLVTDAGSTMTDIVNSVQRVTDIMGEITAATASQSRGIGEVNTSVVDLDQMTQQNAALVEQSAAAAQSLRDQAEQLATLVSTFKLSR